MRSGRTKISKRPIGSTKLWTLTPGFTQGGAELYIKVRDQQSGAIKDAAYRIRADQRIEVWQYREKETASKNKKIRRGMNSKIVEFMKTFYPVLVFWIMTSAAVYHIVNAPDWGAKIGEAGWFALLIPLFVWAAMPDKEKETKQ